MTLASAESDSAKQQQYYQQASDILMQDMPAIPFYYYVQNQLVKPWVGGLAVRRDGRYLTQDIYIKKH